MKHRSALMLGVALIVAACGGDTEPTATTAAASSDSTVPAVAPSTTQTIQDVVVYVAMGDSLGNTPDQPEGVMWQYAEKLEEHFGTEVDLRNRVVGGIHSTEMLDRLRTNESLRADLAEADVVTTDIPIAWFVEPLKTVSGWQGVDPADCGGDDGEQCLRDALESYKADTDAIIDEIVAICDDDTLIRLYDNFMINTGYKLETGTLGISNPYWKAGMDYVEESAARYGIPVAQVYDEFMGPEGTDDPYLKGILGEDQLHPNAEGAALIADLLDGLGYGD
ncbi:MAG: hypothetical protein PVJ28_06855 [Acidimicrobiia bacterium]